MPDDDPLLTVPEIARELRVTEVTVRTWIRAGQLPAIRAGMRGYRVRRSDLERMVAVDRPMPPAPAERVAFEDTSLRAYVRLPDDR